MSGPALAAWKVVSKRFGERRALSSFSLEVAAGEVVGLLGSNGAGKTTALRVLVGLLEPDEGTVSIAGIDRVAAPLEAKRRLGYVPDGAPLYFNLTPLEHLSLVGNLHGLPADRLRAESDRLLREFDLAERGADPVAGFSRGMRQKLAIACALLPKPPLLVLDEPLTGLDTPSVLVTKAVLRGWANRGGAVLLTSHLLDVVERLCDRLAVLDGGTLIAEGSLEELRTTSGERGNLEDVFRRLTQAQDPEEVATRILGS